MFEIELFLLNHHFHVQSAIILHKQVIDVKLVLLHDVSNLYLDCIYTKKSLYICLLFRKIFACFFDLIISLPVLYKCTPCFCLVMFQLDYRQQSMASQKGSCKGSCI